MPMTSPCARTTREPKRESSKYTLQKRKHAFFGYLDDDSITFFPMPNAKQAQARGPRPELEHELGRFANSDAMSREPTPGSTLARLLPKPRAKRGSRAEHTVDLALSLNLDPTTDPRYDTTRRDPIRPDFARTPL